MCYVYVKLVMSNDLNNFSGNYTLRTKSTPLLITAVYESARKVSTALNFVARYIDSDKYLF